MSVGKNWRQTLTKLTVGRSLRTVAYLHYQGAYFQTYTEALVLY